MGFPEKGFHIYTNGIFNRIGPADEREWAYHELLIRADYECRHPGETFEDLKYRARFSKEDAGLLHDWMAVAAQRAEAKRREKAAAMPPLAAA